MKISGTTALVTGGASGLGRATAGRLHSAGAAVVLLDLHLPGMSGIELLGKLKERQSELEAIMLTAHGSVETAIQAMKQGAYDYLFKPLDVKQLRRVVQEALDVARRMREPAVVAETAAESDVDGAIVGTCPARSTIARQAKICCMTCGPAMRRKTGAAARGGCNWRPSGWTRRPFPRFTAGATEC